jgi:GNAT superfamily N-acetyltransferase
MTGTCFLESPGPVLIRDELTLLQIQELRRRAWSANGELPDFIAKQDILKDVHDIHGMHWAILVDGKPVAAARMCIHDDFASSPDPEALDGYTNLIRVPLASLTRLVVHPDFRRLGLSTLLDDVRIKYAEQNGCKSIVGVTETDFRIRKLKGMGFSQLGSTRIRYLSYAPSYVLLRQLCDGHIPN